MELKRRGFLSGVAGILAASQMPAILKSTSIMPIWTPAPDWRDMVRVTYAYDIVRGEMLARYDLGTALGGSTVITVLPPSDPQFKLEESRVRYREPVEAMLSDYLKHNNINPRSLVRLPLTDGMNQSYGMA